MDDIKSTIALQNTHSNEAVDIDEVYSKVFITREGNFVRAGLEFVDEAEIFEGSENKITISQTYRKRFQCTYLLHNFPFDTQVTIFPGEHTGCPPKNNL